MSNEDQRRVYCIEGFYEYEGQKTEPSIKPMLAMLSQWGYWPSPEYKKCKTIVAANRFFRAKWSGSVPGSVLFFATHGCRGEISLSDGEPLDGRSIGLRDLGSHLANECQGRLVHFSSCCVLRDEEAVDDFLRQTEAVAVSGYRADVGWAESSKPALLSDLMLLNELWEANIDFFNARSFRPQLRRIEENLQRRFGDCQFEIVQRRR
ncbi:MAG: hypothetical protein OXQ90_15070 [Gammaproteobacteria bacterium]|nr:hypothetical protein [Gammaproteobacteria bacterium]